MRPRCAPRSRLRQQHSTRTNPLSPAPPPHEIQSGKPIPPATCSWVHYYLAQDTLGPTVGIPYDYVVPDSALIHWHVNGPLEQARVVADSTDSGSRKGGGKEGQGGDAWEVAPQEACPLATFVDYRRAREAGLPLGAARALDKACGALLPALVGAARWPAYRAAGFVNHPELLHVAATDFDAVPFKRIADNEFIPKREVGDPTPVAAWAPDYNATAWPGPPRRGVALETETVRALRAQYEAFAWLAARLAAGDFPLIARGP